MTQPTPNHRPPGSAAPRLVDDLRDVELLSRVERRLASNQHYHYERTDRWLLPMAFALLTLALAVAVYAIAKAQAGVGL